MIEVKSVSWEECPKQNDVIRRQRLYLFAPLFFLTGIGLLFVSWAAGKAGMNMLADFLTLSSATSFIFSLTTVYFSKASVPSA